MSIYKQIIQAPAKALGLSTTPKRKKTTRKPTKAQMKKFVYPMINKAVRSAKKTAYANGRKSVKRVVVRRQMY
ncbi:MAG: hypothetical protein CMP76_12240 [Flavobacterium sp.]|uniref:hypothetical protein n=1 Tax=Flavobacterium sp. TaxID=239 RepID=UPI000C64B2E6|nr:hypothetical protein [Flavobacterium sp.]MBF04055.1 hypothetical protein [Flavobacterium sp.]|tara:strand:+ start:644 stop:862 length:219 start_codon:yes stop_codon:yes gene_type:complete